MCGMDAATDMEAAVVKMVRVPSGVYEKVKVEATE